jgi:hypothetical protein
MHPETPSNTPRLRTLLDRVRDVLAGQPGQWLTLDLITGMVGSTTTASVSARIRDLRKVKFGAHKIEKRRLYEGVYQYRLVLPAL